MLLFDTVNSRIGLKPAHILTRNAYKVGPSGKYGGKVIYAYRLTREFGIDLPETVEFKDAKIDEDRILVLDLRTACVKQDLDKTAPRGMAEKTLKTDRSASRTCDRSRDGNIGNAKLCTTTPLKQTQSWKCLSPPKKWLLEEGCFRVTFREEPVEALGKRSAQDAIRIARVRSERNESPLKLKMPRLESVGKRYRFIACSDESRSGCLPRVSFAMLTQP